MMNYRHPTSTERRDFLMLCDAVGPVEVLRMLGGVIAQQHPDLTTGDAIRSRIMEIAKQLDEETAIDSVSPLKIPRFGESWSRNMQEFLRSEKERLGAGFVPALKKSIKRLCNSWGDDCKPDPIIAVITEFLDGEDLKEARKVVRRWAS